MILVILIPVALIAMMATVLAGYENNTESIRFWKPVHSGLCTAIALFSLTTETPIAALSIGVAASMLLLFLSDIANKPTQKGSLYRGSLLVLLFTALIVQPEVIEMLFPVFFGGMFATALVVSGLSRKSTAAPAAQAVGVGTNLLAVAGLIALIPLVVGASVPLLIVAAGMLTLHGIERVYFPAGFIKNMRTGDLTLMGANLMIAVVPGMIGIEAGWAGML